MASLRSVLAMTGRSFEADVRANIGRGVGWARPVYRHSLQHGDLGLDAFPMAPAVREAYRRRYGTRPLRLVRHVTEPSLRTGGAPTTKLLFETEDHHLVESVHIPMGGDKFSLCVSSQVGCKLACQFCETGRMGIRRNLRTDEIVAQWVEATRLMPGRLKSLVFMGMGEPLDNAGAVIEAIRVLGDDIGLGIGQSRMTLCTAGSVPGLERLQAAGLRRLNISFSLNAATDAKRDVLMPINRKWNLAAMRRALLAYRPRPGFVYAINYCLMPGINDGPEDVAAVASFCRPLLPVLVNIIGYNPGRQPLTRSPSMEEVAAFSDAVKRSGIPVRVRYARGRAVMAACGQLGSEMMAS